MANWTTNIVHIDCSQSVRTDIKKFLQGTETYEDDDGKKVTKEVDFDFNKLIPMPEDSKTFAKKTMISIERIHGSLGRENIGGLSGLPAILTKWKKRILN
jgi:hypothetical protein